MDRIEEIAGRTTVVVDANHQVGIGMKTKSIQDLASVVTLKKIIMAQLKENIVSESLDAGTLVIDISKTNLIGDLVRGRDHHHHIAVHAHPIEDPQTGDPDRQEGDPTRGQDRHLNVAMTATEAGSIIEEDR